VTRRVSLDDETEFAIWKRRSAADARQSRRVLIGHRDKAIGESLVLLLSLKGYDAIYAADLIKMQSFLKWWKPHAVLLDTRLDSVSSYEFMRTARAERSNAGHEQRLAARPDRPAERRRFRRPLPAPLFALARGGYSRKPLRPGVSGRSAAFRQCEHGNRRAELPGLRFQHIR
jgi:CheY-like chemotaxis protein